MEPNLKKNWTTILGSEVWRRKMFVPERELHLARYSFMFKKHILSTVKSPMSHLQTTH